MGCIRCDLRNLSKGLLYPGEHAVQCLRQSLNFVARVWDRQTHTQVLFPYCMNSVDDASYGLESTRAKPISAQYGCTQCESQQPRPNYWEHHVSLVWQSQSGGRSSDADRGVAIGICHKSSA